MLSTIWFIRHAECEINVGLSTSTSLTAQLTPKGFIQASRIAHVFTRGPGLVITSGYLRSKQTAQPMLQRFPSARHEEWSVQEFTYLARSIGQKATNIHERRTLVDEYWERLDASYVDGDGAESFVDFMKRIHFMLEQLRKREEDFIVVFSHGQFILAVFSYLMGLNFENMEKFRHFLLANEVPNGAILKISLLDEERIWFSSFITSHLS